MILIADSGSTKTDWRLIKEDKSVISFSTIGFNPYFINTVSILKELEDSALKSFRKEITELYFYGAGCSSKGNINVLQAALAAFFSHAKIEVNHDMLAAARATCGTKPGITAILGTGSNSCLYDGKVITENVPALGFILGDYGSGADIGKIFIQAFIEEELPEDISAAFKKEYELTITDILDHIYKKEMPNRFLATFSQFVYQHIKHPFIFELVKSRFELFFEKNICRYSNYQTYQLNLIGSVAFVYQDIIETVASENNMEMGLVIKQPIAYLVDFHID